MFKPLSKEDKEHLADKWHIANYEHFLTDEGKEQIEAAKKRVKEREEAEL